MVAILEGANRHSNKMEASCAGYMSGNALPLNALVYTNMENLPHMYHTIELPFNAYFEKYGRETETWVFVGIYSYATVCSDGSCGVESEMIGPAEMIWNESGHSRNLCSSGM